MAFCLVGCPPGTTPPPPPAVTPSLVSVTWQGWPVNGALPVPITVSPGPGGFFGVLPAYEVHVWVTGPQVGSSFVVTYNGQTLPLVTTSAQQAQTNSGWFNYGLNNPNGAVQWDIAIGAPNNQTFVGQLCMSAFPRATVTITNVSQNPTTPRSAPLTVKLGPDTLNVEWSVICGHGGVTYGCAPPSCCDGRRCCGSPGNYYACN
jgi:hypothetical protein